MFDSPRVTIVIPAFQAVDTIEEAVESALAQSYADVAVLVVDDGSDDGTTDRLSLFGDRIRVLSLPHRGLAAARSAGHAAATSDLVAWMDADDIAEPDRIAVQVEVMRTDPELVLVSADFVAFDEHAARAGIDLRSTYGAIEEHGGLRTLYDHHRVVPHAGTDYPVYSGDIAARIVFGNVVHPPTVMIRKAAIEALGPLKPASPVVDDWMYFIRLARLGPFAVVDAPLLRYRLSPGQVTSISSNWLGIAEANLRSQEEVARDADLSGADAARMDATLAERHLDYADALTDVDRRMALAHLREAMRLARPGPSRALRIGMKAILPRALKTGIRRLRGIDE